MIYSRWSGIKDGSGDVASIVSRLSPTTRNTIMTTDTILIDEISMISAKTLEQVSFNPKKTTKDNHTINDECQLWKWFNSSHINLNRKRLMRLKCVRPVPECYPEKGRRSLSKSSGWLMVNAGCHPGDSWCCPMSTGRIIIHAVSHADE